MTYNRLDFPEEFRPITPWGYVGYLILFNIPIVGFIFLIIFSLSNKNINRRNLARAYFCILLLYVIFGLVLTLMGVLSIPSTTYSA